MLLIIGVVRGFSFLCIMNLSVHHVPSCANAGGCATGSQLAAALALGAEGLNMGTRFMATVEAPIHDNIKQALVQGDEHSTALVMRSVRNTERVYKNDTAELVFIRSAYEIRSVCTRMTQLNWYLLDYLKYLLDYLK